MSNYLINIQGLEKRYEGFALENVSFNVPAGSIIGFVGANGAGKTTTIKCALGIAFPECGSIKLFGEEVACCADAYVGAQRFAQLRQDVGFVPDTCAFPGHVTVTTVGAIGKKTHLRWDAGRFDGLATAFQLEGDKKVSELSRGMGMKLSLAFALAHRPRLLILDEATAGLDPLARGEILDTLRDYVTDEECGVLMSSHITSDLERTADRIVCIDEGRIAFDMPAEDITDIAGIARCSAHDLGMLLSSRVYGAGTLRVRRGAYANDVLVPDRFAFAEAFPEIAVDRASIDDYLTLTLKGELL